MNLFNKIIVGSILFTYSLNAFAQNDEIYKDLEKDKKRREENKSNNNSGSSSSGSSSSSSSSSSNYNYNSNYNSSSSSSSCLDGCFFVTEFFTGIYQYQVNTLASRDSIPEVVSMEGYFNAGYYNKYNNFIISPQIRLNWGIFSTEFRQQWMTDRTFTINTLDWQIIKFNIPIHPVTLSMGAGFTHVPDVNITYFQYSLGGRVRMIKNKGLIEVNFRSTPAKEGSTPFLRDFKATFDYEVQKYPIGKTSFLRVSPMVGFLYQNYFNKYDQYYVMAGLNLRLF